MASLFSDEGLRHDYITAPRLILEGIDLLGDQAVVVKYENLVTEPANTVRRVCEALGIVYDPGMLRYGDKLQLSGRLVDPKSIYKHDRPVADYTSRWIEYLDTPEKVEIAQAYLDLLGEKTVARLGYSYQALKQFLDEAPQRHSKLSLPWNRLWTEGETCLSRWELAELSLLDILQHRGTRGTLVYLVHIALGYANRCSGGHLKKLVH